MTLDQRRGAAAWTFVERVKRENAGETGKKIGRHAKRLPIRIMGSGLGQALAFILSKNEADSLLENLSKWVLAERLRRPVVEPAKTALLRAVMEGTPDFLRQATHEALAYLQWMNRFADAEGLTDAV